MKKALKLPGCLAAVLSFLYISCDKHHDTPAVDCITRVEVSQPTNVSVTQLDSINNLFTLNSLSTAGLQFYFYFVDTVTLPGYTGIEQQASAYISYNGLPVFDYSETFIFKEGIYQPAASFVYQGTVPGPDTTTHQTLEDLRTAWLNHYQQDTIYPPFINSHPSIPGTKYRDSCLVAQLGYIDAATFSHGTALYGASLVKVWMVSPLSGGYPMVFVDDSTGICLPVQEDLP
jgi:hypothetical protein